MESETECILLELELIGVDQQLLLLKREETEKMVCATTESVEAEGG